MFKTSNNYQTVYFQKYPELKYGGFLLANQRSFTGWLRGAKFRPKDTQIRTILRFCYGYDPSLKKNVKNSKTDWYFMVFPVTGECVKHTSTDVAANG